MTSKIVVVKFVNGKTKTYEHKDLTFDYSSHSPLFIIGMDNEYVYIPLRNVLTLNVIKQK